MRLAEGYAPHKESPTEAAEFRNVFGALVPVVCISVFIRENVDEANKRRRSLGGCCDKRGKVELQCGTRPGSLGKRDWRVLFQVSDGERDFR